MYDLVIRGGTVVDGTGSEPREADIAIDGGIVREVGSVSQDGRETLDAKGLIVTPGFVDIHTHYDGQATWDEVLAPSSWHGVTTAVMGNCGVGFAPVRDGSQQWLIELMEGVEDIPGSALADGIDWSWETFPEYLDALETKRRVLDLGTQVPHGAVRGYVMGERGAKNEPAGSEDIRQMAAIVKQAIAAGALGFSTSRTIVHRALDGEPVPGTFAAQDELLGIAEALRELGAGLFELAPAGVMGEDLAAPEKEIAWMRKLSAAVGRPVTFALIQHDLDPTQWQQILNFCDEARADGATMVPQVGSRPTMLLVGHQTFHPFAFRPTYKKLAGLPLAELVAELRKPAVRERILSEPPEDPDPMFAFVFSGMHKVYALGDPPDYEPPPEKSVAAIAKREGRSEDEVLYDLMLEHDGRALLMVAMVGYADQNLEAIRAMLEHPQSAFGLGDGGAHCGAICDASMTTFLLSHWVRDRTRGPRLPLAFAVKKMTADTASLYGLNDRGILAPGYKADANIIDLDGLRLHLPEVAHDLPTGARRLVQRADGYRATIVSGEVTWRDGVETGARPGCLIRGSQPGPR